MSTNCGVGVGSSQWHFTSCDMVQTEPEGVCAADVWEDLDLWSKKEKKKENNNKSAQKIRDLSS